jgi:hypothetical protein
MKCNSFMGMGATWVPRSQLHNCCMGATYTLPHLLMPRTHFSNCHFESEIGPTRLGFNKCVSVYVAPLLRVTRGTEGQVIGFMLDADNNNVQKLRFLRR